MNGRYYKVKQIITHNPIKVNQCQTKRLVYVHK